MLCLLSYRKVLLFVIDLKYIYSASWNVDASASWWIGTAFELIDRFAFFHGCSTFPKLECGGLSVFAV
jgi:hypothetical protein